MKILRVPAGKIRSGMGVLDNDKVARVVEDVARVYVGNGRGLQGRDLFLTGDRGLRLHHAALVAVLWHPPLVVPQDAKF